MRLNLDLNVVQSKHEFYLVSQGRFFLFNSSQKSLLSMASKLCDLLTIELFKTSFSWICAAARVVK